MTEKGADIAASGEAGERRTLIANARIIDGGGGAPYAGAVLISGTRIAAVWHGQPPAIDGAAALDARGATLMPGLVEPHAHLSFTNMTAGPQLGEIPPEDHALMTAHNAAIVLQAGFTSCFSAASAKVRLDVAVSRAIAAGHIPGPRLLAASPELTVTGGLGDARRSHIYRESFAIVCDGADEFRRTARMLVREGVDTLKLNISGDELTPSARAAQTVMDRAEVAAVCEVARAHQRRIACHARNAASVKLALAEGIDVIYHATLLDTEAMDLLEAARGRVFVAPTLGHLWATLNHAEDFGVRLAAEVRGELEYELATGCETMRALAQRGVRVLPGGDYGFAWNPNGANARDLGHFVRLLGFTPMQAIVAATRMGGEIMGQGGELGRVAPDCVADLLLVRGEPDRDIDVLCDSSRFSVMQAGRWVAGNVQAAAR